MLPPARCCCSRLFNSRSLAWPALWRGERPPPLAWAGFAAASGGLLWLLAPGVTAPPLLAAAEMLLAGVAWGLYSLLGAQAREPLAATAWNFAGAIPLSVVALALSQADLHIDTNGLIVAMLSGAVASGMGYALWYAVLPRIPAIVAATSQLAAPAIAAAGGVLLLEEALTPRLIVSVPIIQGGVAIALAAPRPLA